MLEYNMEDGRYVILVIMMILLAMATVIVMRRLMHWRSTIVTIIINVIIAVIIIVAVIITVRAGELIGGAHCKQALVGRLIITFANIAEIFFFPEMITIMAQIWI